MGINRRGLFPQGFGNQKGAIHLLLPVVILVAAVVFVSANIKTTIEYGDNQIKGIFVAKKGDGNRNNDSKSSGSQGGRSEEIKEGRAKTDSFQGNTKTKIQQRENESLIETEIETKDEVEEASESADEDETIPELRSISKFPLRIDPATNQLIMTKNGVERVLTVLPAKAVQNMLRAHLKKGLGPKFFEDAPSATPSATSSAEPSSSPSASSTEEPIASESAEITVLDGQITLEENDGLLVYKIPAKKHLKLFGFIPMTTNFTGFVSAESGVLIKEEKSFLSRILDFISP